MEFLINNSVLTCFLCGNKNYCYPALGSFKTGQPPDAYLRYVCTNNADDNITSAHMPRIFSFIFDASILTGKCNC